MAAFERDPHFEKWTESLTKRIKSRHRSSILAQKESVERLIQLEIQFRELLKLHPGFDDVCQAFFDRIYKEHKNLLLARPYFRERDTYFREHISCVFRDRQIQRIAEFHLNGCFVQWYMNKFGTAHAGEITDKCKELLDQRQKIIEENIPLAISRARLFWKKTQKSQLSYMDLMQIANGGLIAAVDKFVLPYSARFRAVIIGRITGDLISSYSRPVLGFASKDKRRLYHAHKAIRFASSIDDLVERTNSKLPADHQIGREDLEQLVNAASHVSLDSPIYGEEKTARPSGSFVGTLKADDMTRPDIICEQNDTSAKLLEAVRKLPILLQKVLVMKGFVVDGVLSVGQEIEDEVDE